MGNLNASENEEEKNKKLGEILNKEYHAESQFEKLPKALICMIINCLNASNVAKMIRLNKLFFKLILKSKYSSIIWKNLARKEGKQIEEFAESELDEYFKQRGVSKFERMIDKYCILYKIGFSLRWDSKLIGPSFYLDDNQRTVYSKESVESSWNNVLSEKKFSDSIHLIEIETKMMDKNYFLYLVKKKIFFFFFFLNFFFYFFLVFFFI